MTRSVFAIVYEPADYTLGLIRNIYLPRGVDWCYIYGSSKASADNGELTRRPILSQMGRWARLRFLMAALRTHDAFVVNGWTLRPNLELFFLNWLFFRKPLAWESDTELSIPTHTLKRFLKWLWLGMIFRRRFCYGFAGGNFAQKDTFRHYGMLNERIRLAPMVIENSRYCRSESKVPGERFRFVFVGRLISLKQVDKIISALPDECELKIVGDGQEHTRLEQLARGKMVEFTGALFGEDKVRALHEADCLVLYSTHDQWGFVVNEALASGIPVIVSDQVGCRHDLVEKSSVASGQSLEGGETGMVVRWDEVEELALAMRKMAGDSAAWHRYHGNALRRMEYWNYALYANNFDQWLTDVEK